ncbi:M81 family metallopeptidase [Terrarubrum flagellatum]|uniref:M81 family metallopeptidase n=1 Tax=Terrirubrum flagellatum TaxID=2895980 RepID=UPI003144EB41
MSLRLALGGFMHESHSFAPHPADYEAFLTPAGFPPLSAGAEMLGALEGTSVAAAGMLARARAAGDEIVPLIWCFASPSGPVTDRAFEMIAGEMLSRLARAHREKPFDGVLIELHGAMVTPQFPDAEGELLRRVRATVGDNVPVVASLDPHVNLTALMVEASDALTPYRTYPHVDMRETGERAYDLLMRRRALGRPFAKAFRAIDYLTPITSQCTLVEPMKGLMAERARLGLRNDIAELALAFGFPYADFEGCSPALACYGDDQSSVDATIDALKAAYDANEPAFAGGVASAAEGVARAIRIAATATKPVVLADTQDNPGGGGHGDTTGLLAELIAQGASGVAFGLINDPESAVACHAAGEGARLRLALGGRSVPPPLDVEVNVIRLSDGRYVNQGPMTKGNRSDLGPTALVEVAPGLLVVVVSRKTQAYDRMLFRHLGVEPEAQKIVALKSSVHFRADFEPIAAEVIVVAAPGPVIADPSGLPFTRLRAGVRLKPRKPA